MSLAIDTSTPASVAVGASATSATSNSFSPPAGSTIFLLTCAECTTTAESVSSITDTSASGPLSWSLLEQFRTGNFDVANGFTAEIWSAPCPSAQTGITVTANYAAATLSSSASGVLLPIVFTGAASSQTGATNGASAGTGNPSASVVTTQNGSWVIAVLGERASSSPTADTGQTTSVNGHATPQGNFSAGRMFWVQIQSAATPSSGTTVPIDTTNLNSIWGMAMAEVLPSGGASTATPAPIVVPNTAVMVGSGWW